VEPVFGHGRLLVFDVLRSKGLLAVVKPVFLGMLAFWPLMCCCPKVFRQTLNWFFGHGSLLAFDVLWSKGLLADLELVFWAW
jgi:hypothetical protein